MKNGLRRITVLAVLTLMGGCAAPISWRQLDHVKAIAWTTDNRPIALAQETRLQGVFHIATPETALESRYTISNGQLVLIAAETRMPVKISFGDHNEDLVMASPIAGDRRFVAILSIPDNTLIFTDEFGVRIGFDGQVDEFYESEGYANYAFAPDGHELYRIWHTQSSDQRVYDCVNITTGDVVPLESPLPEAEVSFNANMSNQDWLPCESSYRKTRSCLSPDGSILALSCDDGDSCTIWLTYADMTSSQLATVPSYAPPEAKGLDELEARYLYQYHTLAWSPDQARLYFCQSPGAPGYVMNLLTRDIISHQPGFQAASWSPDDTSLAGMVGNRLKVWSPVEAADSVKSSE